jgi:hypothetical protein
MPVTAMRDLGPTDVFLYLEEGVPIASPGEWDARPATFAGWLTGIDEGTDAWECMRDDERGNIGALRWLAFAQSGRGLYLLAVIGTDASDEDVATAARILDSLEVEEAAGEEPPLDGFLDFRPETEIVDGREVVDLVFTDGSVVEASWPEELALADIGVRPTTSAQGEGHSSEFFIRHSAVEDVVAGFGRAEVLEEVENGRGGHVTLWRFNREAWRKVLTFQFGDWAVLAFDDSFLTSTPDPDLDTWARELYGAVTDDGFLVLSGGPSMTVAKPSEDPHPDLKVLSARGQVQLELAVDCSPGAISDPIGDGDDHASWCSADGRVFVRVRGSSDFATEVYEGLELVGPPEQAGTLSGELRAQGGPFPGVDDLTQVQVTVTGDATVLVLDVDGAFEVRLPVGEYEVTATFANNLPCESQRVIVSDDQTAEVEIVCNMR